MPHRWTPYRWIPPLRFRLLSLVAALALIAPAHAHWADLAAAEVVLGPSRTDLTLTVPTGLLGDADRDGDGVLSEDELAGGRSALETRLAAAVRLEDARGRNAALRLEGVAPLPLSLGLEPGSHSTLFLAYLWDAPPTEVALAYDLFAADAPNASLVATVARSEGADTVVLTPASRRATLTPVAAGAWRRAASFVRLGVEHILHGYDHLLFLLALLLVGTRGNGGGRRLLGLVTAFTVAHSLTLALAVLEVLTLPPRLVESAIALSIAWVAAENLLLGRSAEARARLLSRRGWVAFGFGLIHGLGFAGILAEIDIPGGSLLPSLLAFNLGVELGQIAVVAAALALGAALRRVVRGDAALPALRRGASLAAGVAGLVWFVERAFPFV